MAQRRIFPKYQQKNSRIRQKSKRKVHFRVYDISYRELLLMEMVFFLVAVAAGPVEDDDEDMKQLMSWANWLAVIIQINYKTRTEQNKNLLSFISHNTTTYTSVNWIFSLGSWLLTQKKKKSKKKSFFVFIKIIVTHCKLASFGKSESMFRRWKKKVVTM